MSCPDCDWVETTFGGILDMTPREYWMMTEIWVKLHGGKDYCEIYRKEQADVLDTRNRPR